MTPYCTSLNRMRDSHPWLKAAGHKREADAAERVLRFRLQAASAAYYVTLDLENIEELFSLAAASRGEMDVLIRRAIAATINYARNTNSAKAHQLFVTNRSASAKLFIPPSKGGPPAKYPKWAKPAGPLDNLNPGRSGPFRMSEYALHVARLLGLFLDGKPRGQNTFITFNYDTVLEEALTELNIPCDYAFLGPLDDSAVPVLKLHGSVNWGQTTGQTNINTGKVRQKYSLFDNYEEVRMRGAEPLLVPPTWKKTFGRPFETIWDTAVRKLETATRIIIIGFSMPPTDMHFKYLLAAGLQNNISLRQIQFVDPDTRNLVRPRAQALLRNLYIDSHMIDFSKMGLKTFTGFGLPFAVTAGERLPSVPASGIGSGSAQIGDLGRPVEDGLSSELYRA
jgi:hypothetical protein